MYGLVSSSEIPCDAGTWANPLHGWWNLSPDVFIIIIIESNIKLLKWSILQINALKTVDYHIWLVCPLILSHILSWHPDPVHWVPHPLWSCSVKLESTPVSTGESGEWIEGNQGNVLINVYSLISEKWKLFWLNSIEDMIRTKQVKQIPCESWYWMS